MKMSTRTGQAKSSAVRKKATRNTTRPKRSAPTTPAALPPDTLFIVDGTIPSPSFQDAVFLADYLADTRERSVEIRRVIARRGAQNVYLRKPNDHENRKQISCLEKAAVLDGDRVIFTGTNDGALAFARGRGAGIVCHLSTRYVTPAQQKIDDDARRDHLECDLRWMESDLRRLRDDALRLGLKAKVKEFDRACGKMVESAEVDE